MIKINSMSPARLEQYIAPQKIFSGSLKEIINRLANSALAFIHRLGHKGEWINNHSVYRKLDDRVSYLAHAVMVKSNVDKQFSLDDAARIQQELRVVKDICLKLKQAGYEQAKISCLETNFAMLEKEMTHLNEPAVTQVSVTQPADNPPSQIVNPSPEPDVSTTQMDSPSEVIKLRDDLHLLTQEERTGLLKNVTVSMNRFLSELTKAGLIKKADNDQDVQMEEDDLRGENWIPALLDYTEKTDLILNVIEKGLVQAGVAKLVEDGNIRFCQKSALSEAYNDVVKTYSVLYQTLYQE